VLVVVDVVEGVVGVVIVVEVAVVNAVVVDVCVALLEVLTEWDDVDVLLDVVVPPLPTA
jgi:hypothetical protein